MKPAKPVPRVVVVVAVAIVGASALWWWMHRQPAAGPLVLQGNVEVRQVNLAFKVAGRIASLAVDEGATVAAGQTLATLDKVYFEESVAQMRAQRDQARANFAKMEAGNRPEEIAQSEQSVAEREATVINTKIALDRAEQLVKTSVGTRKAYDDAMAAHRQATAQLASAREGLRLVKAGFRREDIDAARAQLANADAGLSIAQRQLVDADLIAPSKGVVLTRVREAGAIVNPGETVLVLSLTTPVWVRSYVSELDLGRIKPGQDVMVTTDAPGAKPFTAKIGFISTTAEFTPKTVETRELRSALVYRFRIVADDREGVLRQGMPVTITVQQPTAGNRQQSAGARPGGVQP